MPILRIFSYLFFRPDRQHAAFHILNLGIPLAFQERQGFAGPVSAPANQHNLAVLGYLAKALPKFRKRNILDAGQCPERSLQFPALPHIHNIRVLSLPLRWEALMRVCPPSEGTAAQPVHELMIVAPILSIVFISVLSTFNIGVILHFPGLDNYCPGQSSHGHLVGGVTAGQNLGFPSMLIKHPCRPGSLRKPTWQNTSNSLSRGISAKRLRAGCPRGY